MLLRQLVLAATGVVVVLLIHLAVIIAGIRRHMLEEPSRWRVIIFVFVLLLAHLLEIAVFAVIYRLGVAWGLGDFVGAFDASASDYYYFSAITYMSGYGDINPPQRLRIVAAIEALDGMFMVAISTSAMLVVLQRGVKVWLAGQESSQPPAAEQESSSTSPSIGVEGPS